MRQDCIIKGFEPPQTIGVFSSTPPTEFLRAVSSSPNDSHVKLEFSKSITSVDGPEEFAIYPPTTKNLFAANDKKQQFDYLPK